MVKENKKEKKFVEGIKNAVEGEIVYRRADGQEMMVIGILCSHTDKYNTRKSESYMFVELGK